MFRLVLDIETVCVLVKHLGEGELSEGGLTFTGSSGRRGYETGYPVVHGRVLDICNKTLSNAWVEFDLRREGLV